MFYLYTEEHIQLFKKMFFVEARYAMELTPIGLVEKEGPYDGTHPSVRATIKLSNGNTYVIGFDEYHDVESRVIDAFDHFVFELNQDEEAFEEYLKKETPFVCQ